MSWDREERLILGGAGVFVALIVWLVMRQNDWADECRAKGGVPYCAYKSSCLCLKPGTVLQ
jgi:hypothetical protein